jgi:DNA-directed RNA polymerase subunit RPC12/RpoP
MGERPMTAMCPECGSRHIVDITLPVPSDAPPHVKPTRRAHRCLDCSAQWPSGTEARIRAEVEDSALATSTEEAP